MIYFVDGLNAMVVKALQDSSDWADILNDLRRIDDKLRCGSGTEEDAYELDYELRNKYPAIHAMLQIADTFPVLSSSHLTRTADAAESPIMTRLRQDYCGILCDAAVKTGFKQCIRDCIDHVE